MKQKYPVSQITTKSSVSTSKYLNAPIVSRLDLLQQLSFENKRHLPEVTLLFSRYIKLKILSDDEEKTAGRFSHVGKRLRTLRKTLSQKLERDPSDEEWAAACNLTVNQLHEYNDLAMRARMRLVQHNMRMLDYWVRRFLEHTPAAKDVSYYELLVEGLIGLTKAAESYNGNNKGTFYNYAKKYIQVEIFRALTTLRRGSYVNHKTMMEYYKLNKMKWRMAETLKRLPTDEELAEGLDISVNLLQSHLRQAKLKVVSAHCPTNTNDGGVASMDGSSGASSSNSNPYKTALASASSPLPTYLDLFLADDQDQQNESIDDVLRRVDVNQMLSCLTNQERRVVSLRYGLDGQLQPTSATDIAKLMCMSGEYIRRLHNSAMAKLRAVMEASDMHEQGLMSAQGMQPARQTPASVGVKVFKY